MLVIFYLESTVVTLCSALPLSPLAISFLFTSYISSCYCYSSNCVINLCPNKQQVFQTAYTVLKVCHSLLSTPHHVMYTQFGGEMYFSDIYADRTLSEDIRSNKVLYGNRHSLVTIIAFFLHHYECVRYFSMHSSIEYILS